MIASYDFGFSANLQQAQAAGQWHPRPVWPENKVGAIGYRSLPEPKKLVLIEAADHFFEGRLKELRETIEAWVREVIDG